MKHRTAHIALPIGLLSLFLIPTFAAAQKLQYTISPLPLFNGGYVSAAALNDSGQIAATGSSSVSPFSAHALLYSNGSYTDLGDYKGNGSSATGINSLGQVVGNFGTGSGGNSHGFIYSGGKRTDLGTLFPAGSQQGYLSSGANAINDSGLVVGSSVYPIPNSGGSGAEHAASFKNGTVTDLAPASGDQSAAYSVNKKGQSVGFAAGGATLFTNGQSINLGGGDGSKAYSINDNSDIVGVTYGRAFLYHNGAMQDLGSLVDNQPVTYDKFSQANAINNKGQIVGHSTIAPYYVTSITHAFLDQNGVMYDLNNLLVGGQGWTLVDAYSINNRGQILGSGYFGNSYQSFILTAVPESSGYACFLVMCFTLAAVLFQRRAAKRQLTFKQGEKLS